MIPTTVDETAVIADYLADVTVTAICASHGVALTRLYDILDRHQIPRRQPNAPRLPTGLRERILADYRRGFDVADIAVRQGVSTSTVSNIAKKHGVARHPQHTRDELVDFIVRFLLGDDLDHEKRAAITRVGCRTTAPGLRTLERIDPIIANDVKRRLAEEIMGQLP